MIRALIVALLAPWLLGQASPERPRMPSWWVPATGSGWIALAPLPDRPHLLIPVTINGESGWALVDTGFEGIVLDRHYAERRGLALRPGPVSQSFGGRTSVAFAAGVSMAVGAVHTEAPGTAAVFDLSGLAAAGEHPIDAVIGTGLLAHVAWEVDEDARRLRFLPSGTLPMRHPAALRAGPTGARLVTDIDLGAAGIQPAVVDTGSDIELLVDADLAARAHVATITDVASAGAGGVFVEPIGRLPAATVGGVRIVGPEVRVGDEVRGVMGQPALVGMGLLRGYTLRVDLPAGHLELAPRATPAAPLPKTTSGVQGSVVGDRLPIVHVMLHSPAAAAGLKAGDSICRVDDWTAAEADVRHWGRAAPGTRYAVHLCDGRTVPLVTRAFY